MTLLCRAQTCYLGQNLERCVKPKSSRKFVTSAAGKGIYLPFGLDFKNHSFPFQRRALAAVHLVPHHPSADLKPLWRLSVKKNYLPSNKSNPIE